MGTYIASFPNCGYIDHTFTNNDLIPISNEINFIRNNFETAEQINHSHTSTVKREYKLVSSKNHLENLVIPFTKIYLEVFECSLGKNQYDFELTSAWVNFQEKEEFFAPHTHNGDFSFVLYIEVPFFIEDEIQYVSSNSKKISTVSSFNFLYTDCLGEIKPSVMHVDKTWENKMLFFPGKMSHFVQPFYSSDKFRISVSGNIKRVE